MVRVTLQELGVLGVLEFARFGPVGALVEAFDPSYLLETFFGGSSFLDQSLRSKEQRPFTQALPCKS